jgi:hypothetical protein
VFDLFLNFLNAGNVEVRLGLDRRNCIERMTPVSARTSQAAISTASHWHAGSLQCKWRPSEARVTGDQGITFQGKDGGSKIEDRRWLGYASAFHPHLPILYPRFSFSKPRSAGWGGFASR